MRSLFIIVLGMVFSCNSSQKTINGQPSQKKIADPVTYAQTITQDELKEHLYVYASDEFEGRETGKPGQKKAIEYLKLEYENLGIPPAQSNGNYFQKVPLEVAQMPEGSLNINGSTFPLGKDIITFTKAQGTYSEITYVGYGIESDSYSDYSGINVSGKLVLIKSGEPKNADGTYVVSGTTKKSVWSSMSDALGKKSAIASAKGAVGVLYYDSDNYSRFKGYFNYMGKNKSGQMSIQEPASENFTLLLNEKSATALKPDINSDSAPKTMAVSIELQVQNNNEMIDSENVVAIVKGSEKPDEYLVISSHLDHIGITADGQINNGADDDGSGSVALLEIAEAFQKAVKAGDGPKRSIIFLHVTGEEKGLLGSRYYTDFDPIAPLEETVANLNIDMIGRIDPKRNGARNYLYLIGSDKLSTELHQLSEEVNQKYTNIEFDYTYNDENDPNRFYYRSDHYNFAKNNIPIIFYFNGTHADYHRPGDTPDKINYDLLENRTRLVFYTAWEVANREHRLVVDKASE